MTTASDSGAGSLREAISTAAANAESDTITFDSSLAGQTILLSTNHANGSFGPTGLVIDNDTVTIDAADAPGLALSGNGARRILAVTSTETLTLDSITLSNGRARGGDGGSGDAGGGGGAGMGVALFVEGSLSVSNSTLSGNTAAGGNGKSNIGSYLGGGGMGTAGGSGSSGSAGGGPNGGSAPSGHGGKGGGGAGGGIATTTGGNGGFGGGGGGGAGFNGSSPLSGRGGNGASYPGSGGGGAGMGGGVFSNGGTITITNSTLTDNSATGGSGGNRGKGLGGAVFSRTGSLTVLNATLSENDAQDDGNGVYALGDDGTVTFTAKNSIFGQTDATITDIYITTINGGGKSDLGSTNNLVRNNPGNGLLGEAVVSSDDPKLDSLSDLGGPTKVMALLTGSPAIDAGDNASVSGGLSFDQRGTGFDRIENDLVDIGAFEAGLANAAPTDLAFENTTTNLKENASTAQRIKVADIVVTDDGLGTNDFALTGPDASAFEINGTVLYLKAGVSLDFETKQTYNVTVNVDDSTVGSTPDASESFTLNILDVNESAIQIMNDTDLGLSLTGSWKNKTVLGQVGYKGNLYYASPTTTNYTGTAYHNGAVVGRAGQTEFATADVDTATWTFTDLPDGIYRVSATWRNASNRATNALFTVDDGAGGNSPATKVVNQQLIPNSLNEGGYGWQDLAVAYGNVTSGVLTVTLTSAGATGGGGAAGYGGPFTFVIADAVRIERLSAGPTLDAAGGASSDQTAATLTQAELQTIANAAIARWQGAAITVEQKALLTGLSFSIQNLTGGTLGVQVGESILIDVNGAGYGWFVDTTPNSDSEFTLDANGNQMTATSGPAAGKMDLLTVVLHEIGHRLGLDDELSSDGLMSDTLTTGTRRVPTKVAAETTNSQTTQQTAKQRRIERVAARRAARGR